MPYKHVRTVYVRQNHLCSWSEISKAKKNNLTPSHVKSREVTWALERDETHFTAFLLTSCVCGGLVTRKPCKHEISCVYSYSERLKFLIYFFTTQTKKNKQNTKKDKQKIPNIAKLDILFSKFLFTKKLA